MNTLQIEIPVRRNNQTISMFSIISNETLSEFKTRLLTLKRLRNSFHTPHSGFFIIVVINVGNNVYENLLFGDDHPLSPSQKKIGIQMINGETVYYELEKSLEELELDQVSEIHILDQ